MAKFVNPFGGGSSGSGSSYSLDQLAQEAGIEIPDPTPATSFETILNLLNKPSELTEQALTGGAGYEKSGLNPTGAFIARLALDPLNLVGGLGIGAKAAKGAKIAAKATGKIKPIGKVGNALGEMFVPGFKVNKVSPQLAQELPALNTAVRAKQAQVVRRVGSLGKEMTPEARKNLGKLVEKKAAGGKLTAEEADAVRKSQTFIEKEITRPEIEAGISPKLLADYFPRKVERDAVAEYLKFGGSRLSAGLGGAEKKRKFLTQVAGEEAGVVYKDAIEALAIRAAKSEAARANAGYLKKLITGEVKDVEGNPLVAPLKGGIAPGYTAFTIKGLKGFQAPAEAVKEIEKYYQTFVSDEATNALLKFYDQGLGIWKGTVTSIFPAFHIRNELGNLTNMWLSGFKNPLLLKDAAKIQRGGTVMAKGTKVTGDLLEQLGIKGKGQFGADIGESLKQEIGGKSLAQKINPLEHGRNVGTAFEDNARIALFIDRLNKGDTTTQAVAQVKKYLFDYSSLTPFEQNIMKRVFPFYTWMRNNIPLQIEMLISQPGKYAAIAKTFENLNPLTDEQKDELPPYLTEGLSANLGETPEGELRILSGLGLPVEDLARLYRGSVDRTVEREVLGSAGPVANLTGAMIARDFYRGKPMKELTYTYGQAAKDYPEVLKKLMDYREETTANGNTTYYVNPQKFALINMFAPRLLRVFSDPISGVSFARISDVNKEDAKRQAENRKEKAIEEKLLEKGVVKKFEKTYVPKGTGSGSSNSRQKFINPF